SSLTSPVSLFFARAAALPFYPSFPTRRSSDLGTYRPISAQNLMQSYRDSGGTGDPTRDLAASQHVLYYRDGINASVLVVADKDRSEEHTSELQPLTNLVCRLLLEKKNDPSRNI